MRCLPSLSYELGLVGIAVIAAVACGGSRVPDAGGGPLAVRIEALSPEAGTLVSQARSTAISSTGQGFQLRSDPSLTRSAAGRTHAPGIVLDLPVRACDPMRVALTLSGRDAQVHRVGATGARARREGDAIATYEAWPGIDSLSFSAGQDLEELLLIKAPSSAPVSYRVELPVGHRLHSADLGGAAVVELIAPTGDAWLRLRADAAWDANGRRLAVTARVDGNRITLAPANAEAWPVVLDPAWQTTASMLTARCEHDATVLSDGKVLISGGRGSAGAVSAAELFDLAGNGGTGSFTWTAAMNKGRVGHRVVVLPSGRVLVTGGGSGKGDAYQDTQVFDPSGGGGAGTFTAGPNMLAPRWVHGAVLLKTGKVLIAGGSNSGQMSSASELFDPQAAGGAGAFAAGPALKEPFTEVVTVMLPSGRVVLVGLCNSHKPEIFDPAAAGGAGAFSVTPAPTSPSDGGFVAGLRPDGKLWILGKDPQLSYTDVLDPEANGGAGAIASGPSLPSVASQRALAVMPSGHMLLSGGLTSQPLSQTLKTAFAYRPESEDILSAGTMQFERRLHSATVLPDGHVLLTGGLTIDITSTAELYWEQPVGLSCTTGLECASGLCTDGVCCSTACTGLCEACSALKKGGGADGTCGVIAQGNDPDNECTAELPSTCAQTGNCNGAGACQLYPSGTVCGLAPTCQGNKVIGGQLCDGAGTCKAMPDMDCKPYACAFGSCAQSCASDLQCESTHFCDQSTSSCEPRRANGEPCSGASQCQSSACADGVCCEDACSGICLACSAAKKGSGADGKCGPIAAGSDPDDECGAANPPCGLDGMCSGNGGCRYAVATTVCGNGATCSSAVLTGEHCDGDGMCIAGTSVSCAPYVCKDAKACFDACDSPAQCSAGAWCNTAKGQCETKLPNGTACSQAASCSSGLCVEGVCCNAACAGTCESCAAKGLEGTCVPVSAPPAGKAACNGSGACAGNCDGKSSSCGFPPASVACDVPSCSDGVAYVSSCNGQGACVKGQPASCGAYACKGSACGQSCAADTDCATAFVCTNEGKCAPGGGATCSTDLTQSTGPKGTVSCAPFACEAAKGECRVVCTSSTDCASGYFCDAASKSCVGIDAVDTGDDGGCSASGARGAREGAVLLIVLALLARGRRSP